MKLAEALVLRADLGKRMNQVKARAMNSAVYQEGTAPAEDVTELRADYERNSVRVILVRVAFAAADTSSRKFRRHCRASRAARAAVSVWPDGRVTAGLVRLMRSTRPRRC